MSKAGVVKVYAFAWPALALAVFGYIIQQTLRFNACCRSGSSDMAVGFVTVFLGIPATITSILAIGLLLAKSDSIRRLLIIMLGAMPALLLIGSPLLAIIPLTGMFLALWLLKITK